MFPQQQHRSHEGQKVSCPEHSVHMVTHFPPHTIWSRTANFNGPYCLLYNSLSANETQVYAVNGSFIITQCLSSRLVLFSWEKTGPTMMSVQPLCSCSTMHWQPPFTSPLHTRDFFTFSFLKKRYVCTCVCVCVKMWRCVSIERCVSDREVHP